EAARGGVAKALSVAFRGGAVTGLLVVGLALLGVAGYYGALTAFFDISQKGAVDALLGLGFGGSLISVFARLGGVFFTKGAGVNVERALYQGLIVSGVIAAAAFYPVTHWLMDGVTLKSASAPGSAPTVLKLWLCSLVGIGVTAGLFVLTDYYTSTRFSPVRKTASASQTGH